MPAYFLYFALAIAAVVVVRAVVDVVWHGVGVYRIHRAGPRPLRATAHRLWMDPRSRSIDPEHGPGSRETAPAPPFSFLEEHASGSQPCISVVDGRGRRWRVKWGHEVHSETFAVRIAWACGYFAEVTYFIGSGTISGAAGLSRARACIAAGTGVFRDARFELDDPAVTKLFEEHSWAWNDNPFVGSRELTGLKIVVMLLSNWDTKDRRDVARGSNTAIFEHRLSRWRHEARYLLSDWGGSMGRWGSNLATRGRWDAAAFGEQTAQFVTGADGGFVRFGYTGQRTDDIAANIPLDHVLWFQPILARLDERFLRRALAASGATDDEAAAFAAAIGDRIRQLTRGETARSLAGRR